MHDDRCPVVLARVIYVFMLYDNVIMLYDDVI